MSSLQGTDPRTSLLPARDSPGCLIQCFCLAASNSHLAESEVCRDGHIAGLAPRIDFEHYRQAFDRVKAYIAAGDCYQVNLTFMADFRVEGDPIALFDRLLHRQKTAYGAFVDTGGLKVLSLSPELFVRGGKGQLAARPMKGTLKRGATPDEDRQARESLAADEKNRAENLMIVDLLRNDLGRIAEIGSVKVTDLFSVETYPTLHTMTSGIEAKLVPGKTPVDVLENLFPCGSVTGAPKIRAMEIIAEVEAQRRGLYTGSIGFIAPDGDFCFNVAIRTAVIDSSGTGRIGIGGGIVADSEARAEYDEALLKMRFLADINDPIALIETLLWEKAKGYALLERHIERLTRSAAHFSIPLAQGAAEEALLKATEGFAENRMRVRLLCDEVGITISATPLPETGPPSDFRFLIAAERVETGNRYLYHKTTRRDFYDLPRKNAQEEFGVDEVVFRNERDELTEGSFTNLFVEKDGVLSTPPVAAGLLAGTLRAELIADGRVREKTLYPKDLEAADAIYLGNSVRGLVRARHLSLE